MSVSPFQARLRRLYGVQIGFPGAHRGRHFSSCLRGRRLCGCPGTLRSFDGDWSAAVKTTRQFPQGPVRARSPGCRRPRPALDLILLARSVVELQPDAATVIEVTRAPVITQRRGFRVHGASHRRGALRRRGAGAQPRRRGGCGPFFGSMPEPFLLRVWEASSWIWPAISTPVGTCSDDDEGEELVDLARIGGDLGLNLG